MKSDAVLGAVLGALLAGVSVAGSVWRGDSRDAYFWPTLLSLLIAPAFLFIVLRRRHRTGTGMHALQRSGRIIVTISAALFPVLLAAFLTVRLPDWSVYGIAITSVGTFALTGIVGYLSVEVSVRVLTRRA